jgi:NAD(P)-dependent dehydrogenase (short-subunit alcohol dehydrogenase family)
MSRKFPEGAVAVFGGSGGIGKGVALEFAKSGTDVAIFYRSSKGSAEATAAEIRGMGRQASIHKADARSYDELEIGFESAVKLHGRIHSVVWGAGPIVAQLPLADWSLEQFRASMEIEAFGFYYIVRIVVPHFRASGGGSFIHLGSAGHDWWPHLDGLSIAPKACNESLIKGIAKEEGVHEIRANSVLVGVIDAGQFKIGQKEGYFDAEWERNVKAMLPIKRWGTPEDIGKATVFLASDDGNYVTGQTISVAGGFGV